ncbi:response regulator transcription factor [Helicobacter sp. 23-1045]
MVFILEDDKNIAEIVAYSLKSQRIDSRIFEDAQSLYIALKSEIPQVLVCDIMLPNENGLSVIKKLRENHRTKNIAIIILSALNAEYDKVSGLDLGADDYLTKPFSALELIARVKAQMRRNPAQNSNILQHSGLVVAVDSRQISIDGERVDLTPKEFELLVLLFSNRNRAFSKGDLLENIWGYSNTRTLDIHISSLRAKLGKYGTCIKTIRSIGYLFDES